MSNADRDQNGDITDHAPFVNAGYGLNEEYITIRNGWNSFELMVMLVLQKLVLISWSVGRDMRD